MPRDLLRISHDLVLDSSHSAVSSVLSNDAGSEVYVFGNPAVRSGAFGGWKRVWTTQRIHRAPFTGVAVLAEMTNVFKLLLPLLGVAMIGFFIGELSGSKPIYEGLLEVSREKAE